MAFDISALTVLAIPNALHLLDLIAKRRSIRFGELVKLVQAYSNREETKKMLIQLKDAKLIKEKVSTVEDFSTYYVTAEGFEAHRKAGK